jgi:hypothetical protein
MNKITKMTTDNQKKNNITSNFNYVEFIGAGGKGMVEKLNHTRNDFSREHLFSMSVEKGHDMLQRGITVSIDVLRKVGVNEFILSDVYNQIVADRKNPPS